MLRCKLTLNFVLLAKLWRGGSRRKLAEAKAEADFCVAWHVANIGLAEAGGSARKLKRKQISALHGTLQTPSENVGLAEAGGSSRKLKRKQHFNVNLFCYRVFEMAHIKKIYLLKSFAIH